MPQRHDLAAELHVMLEMTVRTHLGPATLDRDLVLLMCEDAVDFGRTYSPDRIGQRARSAALLLLELACPTMSPYLRRELAVICELTAIGAAARDSA